MVCGPMFLIYFYLSKIAVEVHTGITKETFCSEAEQSNLKLVKSVLTLADLETPLQHILTLGDLEQSAAITQSECHMGVTLHL